jgi:hypothetical protein
MYSNRELLTGDIEFRPATAIVEKTGSELHSSYILSLQRMLSPLYDTSESVFYEMGRNTNYLLS